ncbi:MAG: zinc ribbon domain-containing protein [Ruminococcus sp.]|nr:zinc ribbon domain-containing protein [Ruminococcus sp.]
MSQICKNCGALLADGERLCTNCGKVAPKERRQVARSENQFSAINQGMYENKQLTDVKRQFSPMMSATNGTLTKERERSAKETAHKAEKARRMAKARNLANNNFEAQAAGLRPTEIETTSGNENKSSLHPIVNKIAWIIAGIIFLYFAIGGIVILIYKNSTYDFELASSKQLVAEDYGEAMHNYFESGWWHFRFTKGVYYVGTTKDGDKYEIYFSKHGGKRVVDELYINGEEQIADDIMKSRIMPMFMADEKP